MTDQTLPTAPDPKSRFEVDPRLLEVLVCPEKRVLLRYDRERQELISIEAGLAYPIRDGIPILVVDEARPLTDAEKAAIAGS